MYAPPLRRACRKIRLSIRCLHVLLRSHVEVAPRIVEKAELRGKFQWPRVSGDAMFANECIPADSCVGRRVGCVLEVTAGECGMGAKEPPHIEGHTQRDEEATVDVFEVSGSIKWFDASKGYGFIVPDEDLPDVLLHVTCLRRDGFQTAYEGARVVCEVLRRPKGLQAFRIRAMDNSTAVHPSQLPQRTHVVGHPGERLGARHGEMVQPPARLRFSDPRHRRPSTSSCIWRRCGAAASPSSDPDRSVLVRYGRGPKGLMAAELKPDGAQGPSSH